MRGNIRRRFLLDDMNAMKAAGGGPARAFALPGFPERRKDMNISEVMTRHAITITPAQSLREASEMMERLDTGFLPVGENDELVGTVTDRDIVVRGLAHGHGGDTRVGEVMTSDVLYCFEDDDVDEVAKNLGQQQVRRMPVVNREKRLVGVVSLGDIATERGEEKMAGEALSDISE
jgi:CBS domain-containing protein